GSYAKINGIATLYLNGEVVRQQQLGSFTPLTTMDLLLGRRTPLSFAGLLDEVSVYNRELSGAEIQSIFNSGAGGKCNNFASALSATNCLTPAGLAAWWPLDGSTADVVGTNVGRFTGTPMFTNGLVGE